MSGQHTSAPGRPDGEYRSARLGARARLLSASLVLLVAACAEVPPTPTPGPVRRVSAYDAEVEKAIARHRELAVQHGQAGDLAAAATQWQILVALAPHDETFRRELAGTRAAIARRAREQLAAGHAALKSGDADHAAEAMLNVLALEPDNAEAQQTLREIEKRRAARVQAGRAARANGAAAVTGSMAMTGSGARQPAARPAPAEGGDLYSLEQPLEMFKAGDTAGGLRDLRQYVEANPGDKAGRNRIGSAVFDRGRELEGQGQREQALNLYEQAVALRGEPAPGWTARILAMKKALSDEYFEKGVQAWPADKALAIRQWETSLRLDPKNAKAAARLKDARGATAEGTARAAR